MKYNSIKELMEVINEIGDDCIAGFDIQFTQITEAVEPVSVPLTEGTVAIKSLAMDPEVLASLDDSLTENILHVKSVESIPFSCGTGKVEFMDRTAYMNICESDGTGAVIYLNITLNEKTYKNVPFKLRESADKDLDYIMILNPKNLSSYE